MPQLDDEQPEDEGESATVPVRRPWRRLFQVLLVILGLAVVAAWLGREEIARDVISGQFDALGVPATYDVESIGPGTQTIRNVVIGDPDRPDLTIEQVEVSVTASGGIPVIGGVRLVNPRLFGVWRDGRMSFGSLDPVIYAESDEPFALPDLVLEIVDGRALFEGPFGAMGAKVVGKGHLQDGFAGELAATGSGLALAGCRLGNASLYGKLSVKDEEPAFSGPVRAAGVSCDGLGLALGKLAVEMDARLAPAFDGVSGTVSYNAAGFAYETSTLRALSGNGRFTFAEQALTAQYRVEGQGLASPQLAARRLGLDGQIRGRDNFDRLEVEGDLSGAGLGLGRDAAGALENLAEQGASTPLGDVAAQVAQALRREQRGSALSGSFIVRKTGEVVNAVMPRAVLRGGSGEALLAISRFNLRAGGDAAPRVAGNFMTGGRGLPQVSGRMEQTRGGAMAMRIRMQEYRAGNTRMSLPQLQVAQAANGAIGFAGQMQLSGPMPGGEARNLLIPLDGNWSQAGGLAMWRRCTRVGFDRIEVADLTLDKRALTICPSSSGAIVRADAGGLRVAGGLTGIDLSGKLGATPIRMTSGAVGIAWPGFVDARSIEIALGPSDTASRFAIAKLGARIDDSLSGTFEGAEVLLDAVPLDVRDSSGKWAYADGVLTICGRCIAGRRPRTGRSISAAHRAGRFATACRQCHYCRSTAARADKRPRCRTHRYPA